MGIKIVSLNIEGDKHLAEVIGLIKRERPEVVCLQEVFEEDFKVFLDKFDMKGLFAPMVFIDKPGQPGFKKRGVFGVAMMSKLAGNFGNGYYFKRRGRELPVYGGKPNATNRALVWQKIEGGLPAEKRAMSRVRIEPEGEWQAKAGPTIASTHFTWSKAGQATGKQRRELNRLIKLLDKVKPDVLGGDFNAPRGGEIWSRLAKKFVDNVPWEIKTTLDPKFHYANGVELVVDGFFTSPESKFKVKSIKLIGGVSDHLAIAAELTMKPGLPIDY